MPFAQWGYPHQGQEEFARHYPADYICEAIDQTRGWFYTLLAESTLLFDDSSYRTCLCLGHIVDEDGRKMSKSAGNVLDPWELIDAHGADALRWLMFAEGNPWVSRRVSHHLLEDVVRRFLLTLWNTHVFFTTYAASTASTSTAPAPEVADRPAIDRWVLAELAALVDTVDTALDRYDVSTATRALERFVEDLSNWYVRRNRRRFWKAAATTTRDKAAAYHTLHTCLTTLSQLLAPFIPFLAERLWQDLVVAPRRAAGRTRPTTRSTSPTSPWPSPPGATNRCAQAMARTPGRRARPAGPQRQRRQGPPAPGPGAGQRPGRRARRAAPSCSGEIAEELNVTAVELADGTGDLVERACKPNFRALGPAFQQRAPEVAAAISALDARRGRRLAEELADGPASSRSTATTVTLTPEMVEVVESPGPAGRSPRTAAARSPSTPS
jgi:isoleucyl-tRNA synthetase